MELKFSAKRKGTIDIVLTRKKEGGDVSSFDTVLPVEKGDEISCKVYGKPVDD